ncbi:MAG: hypothetical protein KBB55_03050 [Candidatus Buchananbacteria bacterium]|nr:hypothetical protein [Candidatus Buchananbacteria bacterium]
MKNKPLLIGLGILIIVLIAAGSLYYVNRQLNAPAPSDDQQTATSTPPVATTTTPSIEEVLSSGEPRICILEIEDLNMKATAFVANGKVSGAVTLPTGPNGQGQTMKFLTDGRDTYTWMSTAKTGTKITSATATTTAANAESIAALFKQRLPQEYDYKCEPWAIDESVFVVPTDVKFSEVKK